MINKLTEYCQKHLNNKYWHPWSFYSTTKGILCSGCECPVFLFGKNKGKPDFRRKNMKTVQHVLIPNEYIKK